MMVVPNLPSLPGVVHHAPTHQEIHEAIPKSSLHPRERKQLSWACWSIFRRARPG